MKRKETRRQAVYQLEPGRRYIPAGMLPESEKSREREREREKVLGPQ